MKYNLPLKYLPETIIMCKKNSYGSKFHGPCNEQTMRAENFESAQALL